MRQSLFAGAVLAAALAIAVPAIAQNIDAKEYWLDNGMQVLLIERHETPTFMGAIAARVGSSNETTGITGISDDLHGPASADGVGLLFWAANHEESPDKWKIEELKPGVFDTLKN